MASSHGAGRSSYSLISNVPRAGRSSIVQTGYWSVVAIWIFAVLWVWQFG